MTCVQNKALFQEFVNFCDNQPKDKKIDHSSWESCAVGEFLSSKGNLSGKVDYGDFTVSPEVRHFLNSLFTESKVNHWYSISDSNNLLFEALATGNGCGDTYGEFTQFLKQYL